MTTTSTTQPKVFLSHASEDKDRFVLEFAKQLRQQGLDVWLDRWEMLPGDSLVKKIFTEGIGNAAAVIVVLSKNSIGKKWVAEELDAAVVQRIEQETLLLPVVLDGLRLDQLPLAVRHLLHEPVPDTGDTGQAVERIVRAVLGSPEKPPLGALPPYATSHAPAVSGLDRIDVQLLGAMGEEAVRDFGEVFKSEEFMRVAAELGVSEGAYIESLEVLAADGYIELRRTFGTGLSSMRTFRLTRLGLEAYARTFVEGYDDMQRAVIAYLAASAKEQGTDRDLAEALGFPRLLVLHLLRLLASEGLLGLSDPNGPWARYHNLSPKLRRLA